MLSFSFRYTFTIHDQVFIDLLMIALPIPIEFSSNSSNFDGSFELIHHKFIRFNVQKVYNRLNLHIK